VIASNFGKQSAVRFLFLQLPLQRIRSAGPVIIRKAARTCGQHIIKKISAELHEDSAEVSLPDSCPLAPPLSDFLNDL